MAGDGATAANVIGLADDAASRVAAPETTRVLLPQSASDVTTAAGAGTAAVAVVVRAAEGSAVAAAPDDPPPNNPPKKLPTALPALLMAVPTPPNDGPELAAVAEASPLGRADSATSSAAGAVDVAKLAAEVLDSDTLGTVGVDA